MQVDGAGERSVPWDESSPIRTLGGPGSEVFRAPSVDGDRYVAVRLWCGTSRYEVEQALERVGRASRVSHPSLAAVEACEVRGNAALWIVSEYVPGPTLEAWTRHGRRLPLPSVIELVRNVSLGVYAGLRQGISHHSIHPSNLVIWKQDQCDVLRVEAKLLDLSLASWMQPGTPSLENAHFMAPETLAMVLDGADPSDHIDARANVYSCGALLYYLATGVLPYQSPELLELAWAHVDRNLVAPRAQNPEISEALQTVILGALHIHPGSRYSNPGELASALAAVQWRDGLVDEPRPPSVPPPLPSRRFSKASEPTSSRVRATTEATESSEPTRLTPTERSEFTRRSRLTAWSSTRDVLKS